MNEKEKKKVLNIYRNKIFKNIDNKEELEKILSKIQRIKKQINEDDIRIDELIALTFYLLNNYDESLKIYQRLVIIKTTPKYYLGIYKNYVAKENLGQIITSYTLYKRSLKEKEDMYNSTLIDAILNYIYNNIDFNITYHDKYGFFDLTRNKMLYDEYIELIDLINNKDFSQAISICELLNTIAKENRLNVEFFSLKRLLEICKKMERKNINTFYIDLRNAINTNDINTTFFILNELKKNNIKDKKLVIRTLYFLIQNNYLEDATKLISEFDFSKDYKEQIRILNNAINEINYLNNLDDEQLKVYNEAISKGHHCYHEYDLENAYDYYTWGLYITNAPIFYYYIGKILYKTKEYDKAYDYFEKYTKLGTTKINKAYLYLSRISEKHHKRKKSVNFSNYVQMTNDLLSSEYDFYSIYEQECDPYKVNMQRILKLDESFFSD